jgi:hypothetical protein
MPKEKAHTIQLQQPEAVNGEAVQGTINGEDQLCILRCPEKGKHYPLATQNQTFESAALNSITSNLTEKDEQKTIIHYINPLTRLIKPPQPTLEWQQVKSRKEQKRARNNQRSNKP